MAALGAAEEEAAAAEEDEEGAAAEAEEKLACLGLGQLKKKRVLLQT